MQQLASFEQILSADSAISPDAEITPGDATQVDRGGSRGGNGKFADSLLFHVPDNKQNLYHFHPPIEIRRLLWNYYVSDVDVLLKIIYKPTVEALILSPSEDPKDMDISAQALLFAIYFATLTTMSTAECLRIHKAEKGELLPRYRHALEQSLARVGWMTRQEIPVLQAVILLVVSIFSTLSINSSKSHSQNLGLLTWQKHANYVDAQRHHRWHCSGHGHAPR